MKKSVIPVFVFLIVLTSFVFPDVKYTSTTLMNLEGVTGAMLRFFGAARPVKTVDYYKGNMKRSDTFDKKGDLTTTNIIDLDKELFINIDHKKKTFTQMTFDEWRQMIESTLESLGESEYGDAESENEEPSAEVKWSLDVDVKETGEKETIGGKKCDKVIMILDLDAEATSTDVEEGETPETAKGGIIVTSTQWLYRGDNRAKKEMDGFNKRLAEKLGVLPDKANMQDMMAEIIKSNSQLGEAIEKMKEEGQKLKGMPMRSRTIYETKIDPETAQKIRDEKAKQEEEEKTEIPTSVGGLLGGFGKKMMKKHIQKDDEVKERSTLMTTTTEVLE